MIFNAYIYLRSLDFYGILSFVYYYSFESAFALGKQLLKSTVKFTCCVGNLLNAVRTTAPQKENDQEERAVSQTSL